MTIQFDREWRALQQADVTTNSSNKLFTVTTGKEWLIQSARIDYTTNATVGTRQLELRILDASDNVVCSSIASLTQAASLTYHYDYNINGLDSIALRDSTYLSVVLPHLILPAGYKIRFLDNKAIAPSGSGENLLARLMILERDV